MSRDRFRRFPVDGGLLFFHPDTGTNVRIVTAATATLRRAAPRVAMFGITNACNLRCQFCSRDATLPSRWTVDSAAEVLEGLAREGTLEVALGGGEPFAFPGFADLIARLHETTPLAIHVTTNGTLVREASWRPFRGRFGQVRLSLYRGTDWRDAASVLAASSQLWGANVLVDDASLDELPARLAELVVLDCHDVSLLSYVGPDRARHLTARGRQRLAAIADESPVACRLSVCFGDRVPAPRLFSGMDDGGDCGAGRDFVSITPDKRVQSCSFQDEGFPVGSADDVLEVWHHERATLSAPSRREGCARVHAGRPGSAPPVTVWRAFSGNNSGECVLVGKFETAHAAEELVKRLIPGWKPDEPYTAEWRELLAAEGVGSAVASEWEHAMTWHRAPAELISIGRSVIARSYDVGDAFPELRGLAWKLGGYVVPGGIHVHETLTLLGAIRCHDGADARAVLDEHAATDLELRHHGYVVFAAARLSQDDSVGPLDQARRALVAVAGSRPLAAELLLDELDEAGLTRVLQRLDVTPPETSRLLVTFWSGDASERAAAFARSLDDDRAIVFGETVLFEPVVRRKRLAVLALRRGGYVHALDGTTVRVTGRFWFEAARPQKGTKAPEPPVVDPAELERALRTTLGRGVSIRPQASWDRAVTATIETDDPARALAAMSAHARELGCEGSWGVNDLEPLGWTVRRLIADLRA